MLPTTPDITPDKKMRNCGVCHDGVKAVGILQKERCDSCHQKASGNPLPLESAGVRH
jgi:hypothetical protein